MMCEAGGKAGIPPSPPLPSHAQMSDWERRPLYAGQAEYAALDAWVLPLVYERLRAARYAPLTAPAAAAAAAAPASDPADVAEAPGAQSDAAAGHGGPEAAAGAGAESTDGISS